MNHYIVITLNNEQNYTVFDHHQKAFDYADALPDKTKGVYKVLDEKTLGLINGFGAYEDQYRMQYQSKFNFKVI